MQKTFYLTTTLPYINSDPHIGFALEMIQADVIARFHKLLGDNVFFNTGTDEHGQKIYQKSLEQNIDPQKYCDEYAEKFAKLKEKLNLNYNSFIRTTDEKHIKAAQEFWKMCNKNGDIYKKNYKIKYCIGCELEKTESELADGKCPLHQTQELEIREEENYFFRFSKYQDKLLKLYENNSDFVFPSWRLTEIKNFVEGGLQDFSISRLKEKMPWGISVPDDPDHVIYVWFDALISYISCLGWPDNKENFEKFWPGIQFAGKDNLRQQSSMWQAMLMSAGVANSKQIIIHGFITSNGTKMSKSLGNVVDPYELVDKYGTDALRYYLLKEINPFEDGDFTIERFEEVYNSDLANGLGNLVQRVSKMCENNNMSGISLEEIAENYKNDDVFNLLNQYKFNQALELLWKNISILDKYVSDYKPWEKNSDEAIKILHKLLINQNAQESILRISKILEVFLPKTAETIISIFTADKIKAPEKALFPRI